MIKSTKFGEAPQERKENSKAVKYLGNLLGTVIVIICLSAGVSIAANAVNVWQTEREIQTTIDAMADLSRNNDNLRNQVAEINKQIEANKKSWNHYNSKIEVLRTELGKLKG